MALSWLLISEAEAQQGELLAFIDIHSHSRHGLAGDEMNPTHPNSKNQDSPCTHFKGNSMVSNSEVRVSEVGGWKA